MSTITVQSYFESFYSLFAPTPFFRASIRLLERPPNCSIACRNLARIRSLPKRVADSKRGGPWSLPISAANKRGIAIFLKWTPNTSAASWDACSSPCPLQSSRSSRPQMIACNRAAASSGRGPFGGEELGGDFEFVDEEKVALL